MLYFLGGIGLKSVFFRQKYMKKRGGARKKVNFLLKKQNYLLVI